VGYELHPETPPSGMMLSEYLPNADAMLGNVRSFAAGFGLADLRPPTRLPNTRRAIAIAEHARDAGRLDAFRAAAHDGYWRKGRDLSAEPDLRAISAEAGLDPDAALRAAADPAVLARVDAAGRAAREAGVTGVPTLELAPRQARGERMGVRVVGCQPYAALEAAAKRAGARRR
jgi:predicted DsbA family dithiol-disulfide isomerase